MTTVIQIVGALLILGAFINAGLFVRARKSSWRGTTALICLTALAVFAGGVLLLQERITKLTVEKIGSIDATVEKVATDAKTISEVRQRIEAQAATMDLVAKDATDAKKLVSLIEQKSIDATAKVEALNKIVSDSASTVKSLEQARLFTVTVIAAQNDDRRAFDQIGLWANDPKHPFQREANQVWHSISEEHPGGILRGYSLNPTVQAEFKKLDLAALKTIFVEHESSVSDQLALVDYIWGRADISERERMAFLVSVISDNNSLRVLEHAGSHFEEASKDKLVPLDFQGHLEWWKANKNSHK